jgi:hypothetical protein
VVLLDDNMVLSADSFFYSCWHFDIWEELTAKEWHVPVLLKDLNIVLKTELKQKINKLRPG